MFSYRTHRGLLACLIAFFALLGGGCATSEPVRMVVVGLDPFEGEGMEMRFDVKLRLQNPNETALDYDGVALELELNGKPFATGVSSQRGSVPRFGETLITVPVTVSALSIVRQVLGLMAGDEAPRSIPYVLRGKLAGGPFGHMTFSEKGILSLSAIGTGNQDR